MSRKILFIAAMPPPVHGQSNINNNIYKNIIKNNGEVILFDVAPVVGRGRFVYHISRILRHIKAWFYIIVFSSKTDRIYTVYESGLGYFYNLVTFFLSAAHKKNLFLHHHTSAHTKYFSKRFNFLCYICKSRITNIVLSKKMGDDLMTLYNQNSIIISTNAYSVDNCLVDSKKIINKSGSNVNIGFMSNLSKEKGLHEAVNLFYEIKDKIDGCNLILAGPVKNKKDMLFLNEKINSSNGRIKYVGPVFNDSKINYFRDIDIFLFPSLYKYEAQPIVVLEAMAAGCPVLAIDAGYTGELLPNNNWFFGNVEKFKHGAPDIIINYINDRNKLYCDSLAARRHFLSLKEESTVLKDNLTSVLM